MLILAMLSALIFQADPLIEIQGLIDRNQFVAAETSARAYVKADPNSADGHYLLAYVLCRRANPQESLAEYGAAARLRPPAALDLAAMGSDAFLLEDYAKAEHWFHESVQKDPKNATTWYQLGRTQYSEKHFEDALKSLQQSLKLNGSNSNAQDYLGLSYERLGKWEDALVAYRKAVELGTGEVNPSLDLGRLLVENSRPDEAVQPLTQAVGISPQNAEAHLELGKAYLALDRLEAAQKEVEKAAALSPDNAPVHFLLAKVYRRQGFTDKANAETSRYAELTGTHSTPETPLAQARSLLDLGRLHEADNSVRGYLRLHPQSGEAHFLLGYVLFKEQSAVASLAEYTEGAKYRKPGAADLEVVGSDYVLLKDYPDADKWFSMAVEWNPQDELGWYYLGRTKYNENRFDEAVTAFQKCLLLKPKDVKAEDNLGLSYEGLNQMEEAASAYQTAISWEAEAQTKDAGPYLDLGNLLVESGKPADALIHLRQADAISPEDFRIHRALGKAYAHLNDNDQARQELEKAAKLAPDDAPIHFVLAQVYRKLGLADKAKAESDTYSRLTAAH